jgi:hypothetical protein
MVPFEIAEPEYFLTDIYHKIHNNGKLFHNKHEFTTKEIS